MEEKIIWKGSSSQIVNMGAFLGYFLLFAGFAVGAFIFRKTVFGKGIWISLLAVVIILLPLIMGMIRWLKTHFTQYEFTTERIRLTNGVFSRNTSMVELYRVKDYNLTEPFWFRLCRLGNINLDTSDPTTPKLTFHAIPHGRELLDKIRAQVEIRRDLKRVRQVDYDELDENHVTE